MKIKSFEPYHIGTKLKPNVDIRLLKKKIRNKLKGHSYKIIEDSGSDSIIPQMENLAVKNDVNVVSNAVAQSLNVIGDIPEKVMPIFKEVNKSILELGYEEKSTISFYEIITNVNVEVETTPLNLLNKHSNLVLDKLKDCDKLNTLGIRLSDKLLRDDKEFVDITIEPKPTSPNKFLLIAMVFRSPDIKKIINFHQSLKSNIEKIIKKL